MSPTRTPHPDPAPAATAADAVAALSPAVQDYLKAIWALRQESGDDTTLVGTKALAERLGVAASTASETVKRLSDQGYVDHARYGGVQLTATGEDIAVQMVRRHRIIETWLVDDLGYSWDEVVDEAEILEHAVTARLIDRLHDKLGRPNWDPHGDPIPTADGHIPTSDEVPLVDLAPGQRCVVARISDRDGDLLRYFESLQFAPGATLTIEAVHAAAGLLMVTCHHPDGTATQVPLGMPAAEAVWVSPRG